jgi:hypothetical protein
MQDDLVPAGQIEKCLTGIRRKQAVQLSFADQIAGEFVLVAGQRYSRVLSKGRFL